MVQGDERSRFARDAYSILHFPVVPGIVMFAFGAQEVVAHPADTLSAEFRFASTTGVSLVLLAVVAGTYRAIRRVPFERLVAALAMIPFAAVGRELRADVLTAIIVAGLIATLG